jgi:hypothetical protein
MTLITLRSPEHGVVDLVITRNGDCDVIPVSPDQLRLLAVQAVTLWAQQCERVATSGSIDFVGVTFRQESGRGTPT